MKIAIVFNRIREDTMGIYFQRALTALGFSVSHFWSRDAEKIPVGYDLYFRVDDDYYAPFPRQLRPQVLYVSDIHLEHVFKKALPLSKPFDIVFSTMRREIAKFAQKGIRVYWLNVGCDPEIHMRLNLPRKYDISFVGTEGGIPRKFYLQELRERYPNCFIGQAPHTQMSEIYSQAKIGFSYAIRGECFTMRNYEIMSSAAMLLQHKLRDDSAELLGYVGGRHFISFSTPKELFDGVDYYLSHEMERMAIAEAGFEHTRAHHTYKHAMREMLEVVREKLNLSFTLPEVSGYVPYHSLI